MRGAERDVPEPVDDQRVGQQFAVDELGTRELERYELGRVEQRSGFGELNPGGELRGDRREQVATVESR